MIAVAMTPVSRRGRAVAVVTAGWNLTTVLGAPLGAWLYDHSGWRTTSWSAPSPTALTLTAATTRQ
ncbi:MFS transporter [Streptomyces sp. Go40/10]|nr:MFS transporter [Streptomyces sp. Go40/10]